MNQDQQTRPWWKDNWLVPALVALIVVITTVVISGYLLSWEWTGLVGIPENPETRTAWDWLGLLIIPLVLALGAFWFNRQERKAQNDIETRRQESAQGLAQQERENDRKIAEDRTQEEALQRYLDRMQELILDKELRNSKQGAEIRDVARARTLTVLRSLDGNRKGQVARFLCEADLIGKIVIEESWETRVKTEAIIDLGDADLRNASLSNALLWGANLVGVNLVGANLSEVSIVQADLVGANLSGANLTFAVMCDADLTHADLVGANLRRADLSGADLSGANLSGALLWGTKLRNANLTEANLVNVNLHDADLTSAHLRGANLSGVNLVGADLGNADLRFADLGFADLRFAYLRVANLSGVKEWTNEQLAQAESLVGATMPDGTVMTEETWEEFKKLYRQSSQTEEVPKQWQI